MCNFEHSRRKHRFRTLVFAALAVTVPFSAAQAETTYQWAGFGTIGAGVLDDNSINDLNGLPHNLYDDAVQTDVDTRLGLQGSAFFSDQFSGTVQVVADSKEDDIQLEWAYLSYDINPSTRLRIGRLRRPLYAQTEVLPVGYVYPWARPPVEVYSNDIGVYDALDAIDLIYEVPVGDWNLSTEVYVGSASGEAQVAKGEDGGYNLRENYGLVLQADKDWLSLRFGYHRSQNFDVDPSEDLKMLFDALETAGFSSVVDEMRKTDLEGDFISLSAGIDYDDWLLNAEIIDFKAEGGAVPIETSWYLMGGRRLGSWTLSLTYADRQRTAEVDDYSDPINAFNDTLPDIPALAATKAQLSALAGGVDAVTDGFEIDQESVTLGIRYDFDMPVSIKTEYQRINDKQFSETNNLFSVVVDFLF